jgi:hypothetical protein
MIHQVKLLDFGFDQLLLGEDADQPEAVALGLNDINFRKKQFFLAVSQSIKAFASHIKGIRFTHFQETPFSKQKPRLPGISSRPSLRGFELITCYRGLLNGFRTH